MILAQIIDWEQIYSFPADQRFIDIEKTDSGYLAIGQRYQTVYEAELLKIDTAGQLLWSKRLFNDSNITGSNVADLVAIPNELSYYVAGSLSRNGDRDYIAKIDDQGNIMWLFEYIQTFFYTTTLKLVALPDKSVISVGFKTVFGPQDEVFVRRLDSTGSVLFERIIQLPGNQVGTDIIQMLDGSLLIAGRNGNDNLIMRIDVDGRLLDHKVQDMGAITFSTEAKLIFGNQVIQTGIPFPPVTGTYQNLNVFYDTSYVRSQNLGLTTLKPLVDADSNIVVRYFDGSNVRFRYSDSKVLSSIWDLDLGPVTGSSFKSPQGMVFSTPNSFIAYGYYENGTDEDYWLARILGVAEEWIPDYCSYQPPSAGFDFTYNYPTLIMRDTSSGGLKYLDTVYTWNWNTSNGFSGTDDSLMVLFDTAVNKTLDVQLIISNWYGCTDTINTTLDFTSTGIQQFREMNISVYPNPTQGMLQIELDAPLNEPGILRIFDLNGRLHFEEELLLEEQSFNLDALNSGIYIYEVSVDEQVSRDKLFIRK